MLLPAVTAFSAAAAIERYATCARTIGVAQHGTTDTAAAEQLIQALYWVAKELGVPSPKSYGIAEGAYFDAIPTMAAQALASGSPNNNPRIPTQEQIEEIYRAIW
jgi:alcohol dehydrogenase class IV